MPSQKIWRHDQTSPERRCPDHHLHHAGTVDEPERCEAGHRPQTRSQDRRQHRTSSERQNARHSRNRQAVGHPPGNDDLRAAGERREQRLAEIGAQAKGGPVPWSLELCRNVPRSNGGNRCHVAEHAHGGNQSLGQEGEGCRRRLRQAPDVAIADHRPQDARQQEPHTTFVNVPATIAPR